MVSIVDVFDSNRGGSAANAATCPWPHPFAEWSDDPRRSPPALVARLRGSADTDDALRVATVSAVHRVLDQAAVPHVLPIRAVERDGEGRIVLAYRRVVATDLATLVERGPLPQPRAFAILRQVCRSLAAAHAVGIDHCLLGPASVLLEPQGEGLDRVWLTDFGIAQLFESDDDTSALALHPITPERVFGGATEASEDVYLVGCLAFWLFAGVAPFAADDLATLQRRHAIEDAKRLSEVAHGGIPAGLDALVARALEKDPDERWSDLEALEDEVARIEGDLGVPGGNERRGHTMILRTTTVLPTVGAPVEAVPEAPPVAARRSATPLVLTAIGFSIGMIALGFVDAAPEHDVNQLARAAVVERSPAPSRSITPQADAIADAPAPIADAPAPIDDAPALPPIPGPVAAVTKPVEPVLATTAPTRADKTVPVQAPRKQDDARRRACELVRAKAAEARITFDWVELLRLTDERACWPSERARVKLRVKALLELHRFSECVETGRDAGDDPELTRWVDICRKRMDPTL